MREFLSNSLYVETALFLVVTACSAVAAFFLFRKARISFPEKLRARTLWVSACAATYFAVFTALSFMKYRAYNMGMIDFGGMDQAIWNTLHGRLLLVTSIDWGNISRLGAHVEPIFILLSPLYLLWDDGRVLLLVQALFLAAGAFPLFRIAREMLRSDGAALGVVVCYFLYPALQYANLFDFHGDTLAVPLLIAAVYYLRAKKYAAYWIFAGLAIACKEYVPLIVAGLGVYGLLQRRGVKTSLVSIAVGLLYFFLAVGVVIPHFSPETHAYYLERSYAKFGGTEGLTGVAKNLLLHPLPAVKTFFAPPKIGFLLLLVVPLAGMPLASPSTWIPALPYLLILLLHPGIADIRNHHAATLVPFALIGAAAGIRNIAVFLAGRRRGGGDQNPDGRAVSSLTGACLAASLVATVLLGPSPLARKFWTRSEWFYHANLHNYRMTRHDRIADIFVKEIPPGVPVSASIHLGPHVCHRKVCWPFPLPEDYGEVDVVFLDILEYAPADFWPRSREMDGLRRLLADGRFRLERSMDGLLLFFRKRETPGEMGLAQAVERCPEMSPGSSSGMPDGREPGITFGNVSLRSYGFETLKDRGRIEAEWLCTGKSDVQIMPFTVLTDGRLRYRYPHVPTGIELPMQTWKAGDCFQERFEVTLPPRFRDGRWTVDVELVVVHKDFPIVTEVSEERPWFSNFVLRRVQVGRIENGAFSRTGP